MVVRRFVIRRRRLCRGRILIARLSVARLVVLRSGIARLGTKGLLRVVFRLLHVVARRGRLLGVVAMLRVVWTRIFGILGVFRELYGLVMRLVGVHRLVMRLVRVHPLRSRANSVGSPTIGSSCRSQPAKGEGLRPGPRMAVRSTQTLSFLCFAFQTAQPARACSRVTRARRAFKKAPGRGVRLKECGTAVALRSMSGRRPVSEVKKASERAQVTLLRVDQQHAP